jgi:hypothetical protein
MGRALLLVLFYGVAGTLWCVDAVGTAPLCGDIGNLGVTLAIAAPNVLVPYARAPPLPAGAHWTESYWFKFNVWIAVFVFVASYFWTEYFFDVLRMTYNFPHLAWNLDAVLLGSGAHSLARHITPLPSGGSGAGVCDCQSRNQPD